MPTEYVIWIVIAGVVGLAIGFAAAYAYLRSSANRHKGEIMSLRTDYDEKRTRLEASEQRAASLERRVDEKESQLKAAQEEIHHLEATLKEKADREKQAIESLRGAYREDVTASQKRAA